jgi:FHA domain
MKRLVLLAVILFFVARSLAQTWGVVVLLIIVVGLAIIFRDELTPMLQKAKAQIWKTDRESPPSPHPTRRIVGVVITYTWRPEGQLFPIHEGQNFIGRADISAESMRRPCDIQIPQDPKMSAEHALILYRPAHRNDTQESYEIIDQETANGTSVNGELLKSNQGVELPNYATIRTGTTEWTFIMITSARPPAVVSTTSSIIDDPPK